VRLLAILVVLAGCVSAPEPRGVVIVIEQGGVRMPEDVAHRIVKRENGVELAR